MAFSLTLCADDYGMTEGVSRGILETAVAGRVSAVSAMTSRPDWPRAARAWAEAAPDADLGLHVTLTVGQPLGSMPTFAPTGDLPSIGALLKAKNLSAAEVAAEIGRQIDAFADHAGRPPTHVDGHQHVHVLPVVRDALLQALTARGMHGTRLRDSGDTPWRICRRRSSVAKAFAVAGLARGFSARAKAAGYTCNDGFAGFSSFAPAADLTQQFVRYLTASGPNHLVMCHPGYVDDALLQLDPVTNAREAELRFLLSEQWPALMRRCGARLQRQA